MVDTDRNNVRFVATVDSIIVRFHARYCSFHPTEKEYIEICLCLSILWHFWYGKVNYDTSSDNINCESSLFNLISSETYHFLTKSTPCNLRKRTSRRCRISIMRILGWWLWFYPRGAHFVWHGSPMLEHKFAENGVFLSNGARESRTAIWGVKVKKIPPKGLDFTIILPGILRACSPSREIIGNDTLVKSNNSQNCPPEGNGVHFIFEVDSILIFSEESDGVDHFLKKGAQHANFGPFLAAHE